MIIEHFNAKEYTVLSIFTRVNAPFYIPIYQRRYNWTIDNEIKELVDDLKFFYKENKKDKDSSYYLGNIVVKTKLDNITEDIEEYILIDGQQRLTTILLFINNLKISLLEINEGINNDEKEKRIKSLENILYIDKGTSGGIRRLQIRNPNSDIDLRKIFELQNFNDLSTKFIDSIYYRNFKGIKNLLDIKNINDWDKWLSILQRIKIAQISLGTKDKEISVFESINSKGLSLDILDLTKNYLFLVAENSNLNEDSKNKIDYLISNQLEPLFINENGKRDIKSMNRFYASLISKEGLINPNKEKKILYNEFKKLLPNKVDKNKFDKFMLDFSNVIYDYKNLIKISSEFANSLEINNYSKSYLANSKLELYLTLFLIMEDQKRRGIIDKNEEDQIYELLDIHNISMSITNNKNKDNKFLFKYIEKQKGNIKYNSLHKYLTKNYKNKSRLSTRAEFIDGIENTKIYNVDSKIARYILYRIENYIRSNSGESISFKFTLEHIFPIDDTYWKDKFNDKDYKDSQIHTLGNLTLVKGKLNSSMSNSKYEIKVKDIKKSSLKLNEELLINFNDWKIFKDDNSCLKRTQILLKYIEKIWPLNIMDDVKLIIKDEDKKDYILNQLNKLSIKDAIKVVLFDSYPKSLSLNDIEKELKDLIQYIDEIGFDIEIKFDKNKISTGGWMTERLHSNWINKKDSKRFEEPLFNKNKNKRWSLVKEEFKKMNNNSS